MITRYCSIGYFLKFWRSAGDRFFLLFAIAFALCGIKRIRVSLFIAITGIECIVLRLIAFILILAAVIDKNRK